MTVSQQIIDDYEQRVVEQEDRINTLAANLLEERAQRREIGEALVRVTEDRDEWRSIANAVAKQQITAAAERDEARDEVVRLGRNLEELDSRLRAAADAHQEDAARLLGEIERLRTIIGESGAAEAGEGEL